MLPFLTIGPLSLPVPGLLIILGLWFGINLSERISPKYGIESSKLYNLVMVIFVSAALGARLGFITKYPAGYLAHPFDALALNLTTVDGWSAAVCGLLALLIYSQRNKMPLLSTLDALTPLAAMELVFIHLANLASGAAFGSETSLPWAISLWGAERHPVQLYEAFTAAGILMVIWVNPRPEPGSQPGKSFLIFTGLSAGARLFLEAFHGDSFLIGELRAIQLAAWAVLALTLFALSRLNKAVGV